ncbi:MAG: molybdopterin dinucleotide binding domain-containing protein, partial [Gammaproteobacteria bacterium]
MTRTGAVPRLTRHTDEPLLEIHPDDAAARGLVDGALCTVTSAQGSARLRARVGSTVRAGEVCAAMHWTRTQAPQSCVNVLVNAAVDPHSGQPEFKHTPVEVAPWPVAIEAVLLVRTLAALPAADYVVRVEDAGHTCIRLAQQTSASANSNTPARWLQEQLAVALGKREAVQWLLREDCAGGRVAVAALVDGRLAGFAAASSGGAFAGLPAEPSAVPVAGST